MENAREPKNGYGSALCHASRHGHVKALETFLHNKNDFPGIDFIFSRDPHSELTPLEEASLNNHFEVVKLLVEHIHKEFSFLPFSSFFSISNDQQPERQQPPQKKEKGTREENDVFFLTHLQKSALKLACSNGNYEIFTFLIEKGGFMPRDRNDQDEIFRKAIKTDQLEIAKYCHSINMHIEVPKTSHVYPSLIFSSESEKENDLLCYCTNLNMLDMLVFLVEQLKFPVYRQKTKNLDDFALFHVAAMEKNKAFHRLKFGRKNEDVHAAIIRFLLTKIMTPDLDQKDQERYETFKRDLFVSTASPFYMSCIHGFASVVREFLSFGDQYFFSLTTTEKTQKLWLSIKHQNLFLMTRVPAPYTNFKSIMLFYRQGIILPKEKEVAFVGRQRDKTISFLPEEYYLVISGHLDRKSSIKVTSFFSAFFQHQHQQFYHLYPFMFVSHYTAFDPLDVLSELFQSLENIFF